MLSSSSNLSIEEQHVIAAATIAKRNDDNATATTYAVAAPVHREQEAHITAMAAACNTLDDAWVHERAAALTWEKEKTIAHYLEQQLTAAHRITIPQDDDNDPSVDADSNPDAALAAHLHVQAAGI
jgi:hypothetical protein